MAKFNIKTVKPKFTITTAPDNKIDVVVNKPILTAKNTKTYFKLKNTGGLRGEKGDKGDTGTAATIAAGTATSLPSGSTPTVTNTGTSSAAVFNFGIPKGDKGDKGDTGATGAAGSPGEAATISVGTTSTGLPGTNASVTNTGTSSAAVLNFTIPKGAKGDQGNPGTAATVDVGTTTTGDAGTSASVTNSGTSSAAVFDFTIPKGDKGDTGSPGDAATVTVGTVTTGAPGTSASVVNSGTSSAAVFDFTIPRGDKGESGSGAGDMLASDYDPNGTVQNAGGIVDYVDSQIPTVNNATLTIQQNGSNVQTFTANQGTNATANITVPTKTSDLTNDSGFITDAGVTSFNGSTGAVTYTAPVTSVNGNTGAVTISVPTATSDLTNDSGFITSADLPTVNNATLTIQKNGATVQTFTANQSTAATANITVPTATSDLTNDSGFLTSIPTASASTLGGIMVGSGLSVDGSGVLSASSSTISSITNATIDTILTK